MKRLFITILLAVGVMASAQTKQATMLETTRDTLHPEIVEDLLGGVYIHIPHPETEFRCGFDGIFRTFEEYSQYLWEVDEAFLPIGGDLTDYRVICAFTYSGYLKVTVWDSLGNTGTDSIWFNIKDWIDPMPDFMMEIDSTNHAVFSGTATSDHRSFYYQRSLDTVSWVNAGYYTLPTGHWSCRDDYVRFTEDTIWNYKLILIDSCGHYFEQKMNPGMVMGTQPAPGGGWYLTMKSVMQSNKKELEGRDGEEYVYALYTVDQEGVRHPFEVDGEQVVLPTSTQAYLLPGPHPDAFYQGAIARFDASKDDGMEILSYSNKVVNPLPDLDDVDDITTANVLKVWPNPNNGTFTVEGEGRLKVFNLLGQIVFENDITGKLTLTLPSGMYLVRLSNGTTCETRKVVVE